MQWYVVVLVAIVLVGVLIYTKRHSSEHATIHDLSSRLSVTMRKGELRTPVLWFSYTK